MPFTEYVECSTCRLSSKTRILEQSRKDDSASSEKLLAVSEDISVSPVSTKALREIRVLAPCVERYHESIDMSRDATRM